MVVASWAVAFNGTEPDPVPKSVAHASAFAAATGEQSNVSRSLEVRPPLPDEAESDIVAKKYATAALKVHTRPAGKSPVLTEIKSGAAVRVTGQNERGWAEIVHKGANRWVNAKMLAAHRPAPVKPTDKPTASGPTAKKPTVDTRFSSAPCASGSAVEAAFQPDTIRVHRAVCAKFPQITSYLTRGGSGEHGLGLAVDIMTSNLATGDAIVAYLRANARELGVSQLIWQQRIWTVQRSAEGWRGMADRGSATANHRDHVHVTTYGDRGTS